MAERPAIAIVGSGPAGCYAAQALLRACPEAEITVIDRLMTPYGLVRYGVAADHQGTKGVTRQFARLFERQGVGFVGNVDIGRDLTLDALLQMMDVVVLATGLSADRSFDVPGADLPGIYGAGAVTRFWNGHPDSQDLNPAFGQEVAVFGNGNVALDIVRLMSKDEGDLIGSDFHPDHTCRAVRTIHVIGRSALEAAKCDAVMARELMGLRNLRVELAEGDSFAPEAGNDLHAACAAAFAAPSPVFTKRVVFHSGWAPEKFLGRGRLACVSLRKGEQRKTLACDSVVTAIGFEDASAFDRPALLQNATCPKTGQLADGLFAAGWFKNGPVGTIPTHRADAQGVATRIATWLNGATLGKPGRAALLAACGEQATTYADWLKIDAAEVAAAPPNRRRTKLTKHRHIMSAIERLTA